MLLTFYTFYTPCPHPHPILWKKSQRAEETFRLSSENKRIGKGNVMAHGINPGSKKAGSNSIMVVATSWYVVAVVLCFDSLAIMAQSGAASVALAICGEL